MRFAARLIRRIFRTAVIVLLVLVGSTLLVRMAPGYLSDARELDPHYAAAARAELNAEERRSASLSHMVAQEVIGLLHLNFGVSREYEVSVGELIQPRLAITGGLLLRSIAFAWILAISAAAFSSLSNRASLFWQVPTTVLLATPVAAMATFCLLTDNGGPVLVMTLILAARDFKFVERLLRAAWINPHILQGRAQGISTMRLLTRHVLPGLIPQLTALATLSIVTALSALVPIEVIFNVPGLGQLAWNAAMNRDLPVLLAVTLMMAIAVAVANLSPNRDEEARTV